MISLNSASHFVAFLKYANAHELIFETETDSQTENRLVVARGGGGWSGIWGLADANRSTLNG